MFCWLRAITLIKVSFQSQGYSHPLQPLTSLSLTHKQTHTVPPPKHLAPNNLTTTPPASLPGTAFKSKISRPSTARLNANPEQAVKLEGQEKKKVQ